MSKKRDPSKVANELAGASRFFHPKSEPTPPSNTLASPPPLISAPQSEAQPTARTGRTPVPSARRQLKRHAFDIYLDQLQRLQQIAHEDRMRGGTGSMSQMIREAIDRLIAERSGESQ